jgi:hypothetical protein
MKKYLILIVVIVPTVAVVWIGWRSLGSVCGEQTVWEETSPDGRYVAVWLRRNCGSSTSYADHINLRLAKDKFKESFNGTIKADEVFTLDTTRNRLVRFGWADSRTLKIEYQGRIIDLPHKNSWNDVQIQYLH